METYPLKSVPRHDGVPRPRNNAECNHLVGVGPKAAVQSVHGTSTTLDPAGSLQRPNAEASRRDCFDLAQPMGSAPPASAMHLIGAVDQTLAPYQSSPANISRRSLQSPLFAALSIPQYRRPKRPAVLVDSTDHPAIHRHAPNCSTAWNHIAPWQPTGTGNKPMRNGSAANIALIGSDDARTGAKVRHLLGRSVDQDITRDLINHSDTLTAAGPRQTDTESHGRVKGGRNRTRT